MAFDQRVIKLSPATYDKVTAVKAELQREKQRQVTYDEAIEYLLTYRDTTAHLAGTEASR